MPLQLPREAPLFFSRWELTRGQVVPPEYEGNLRILLQSLHNLRLLWGRPMTVSSGFRSLSHNKAVGGARASAHLTCQAADIADLGQPLSNWLVRNEQALVQCVLWMEDPRWTPTWTHLQIRPARSRIFIP